MMLAPWLLLALAAAPPAPRPVVVVMYFANETNDPSFDVLQKGLADMMITDLIESDRVSVVEREKIQLLFDELKLQRSKYFDPSTVTTIGKMIGATHAVTGSIQEVKTRLRLSVRLIEQKTGRVVIAKEVFGPKDALFELQQKLVELLLGALDLKGIHKPQPVGDFETLITYSKAVDLADQGKLTLAAARLDEILTRSPELEMAKGARDAIIRRIRSAGSVRQQQLEALRKQLLAKAEAVLADPTPMVKLADLQAGRVLTYRVLRGQCLALAIRARLTPIPIHSILQGQQAPVHVALLAYRDNLRALQLQMEQWRGGWRWFIDPEDKPLLEQLDLGSPSPLLMKGNLAELKRTIGLLSLAGVVDTFTMRPTLGELEAGAIDDAARLMDEAAVAYGTEELLVRTLDEKASGLLRMGRKPAAIKQWQALLEEHPKTKQYAQVEGHLTDAMELSPNALREAQAEKALAAAGCDPAKLDAALPAVLERRAMNAGLWGVQPLIAQLEQACPGSKALAAAYGRAGEWAHRQNDCDYFNVLAAAAGKIVAGQGARMLDEHPSCIR